MNELALGLFALLYVIAAGIDLYVVWRLVPAAWQEPHIDVLTGAAVSAFTVAVGGVIGALLGLNGVWLAMTGVRIVSAPITLFALVVALGAPSLGKLYMLRLIRRWDRQRAEAHAHKRDGEPRAHHHRRITDPPPDGPTP